MTAITDVKNLPGGSTGSGALSADERRAMMSVGQLMWLRFRRNRLAMFGLVALIVMYTLTLFADFVAPYTVDQTHTQYVGAPPHGIHFRDTQGNFSLAPVVFGLKSETNLETFRRTFTDDPTVTYPVRFFASGTPYQMFGLIPTDKHLFTVEEPGKIFILGTDSTGRDLFSRILSGYFGGVVDNLIQRAIEVISSIPQIPLWLALAAAVPPNWSPVKVYFGIAVVLSFVSWGGLARQVRGIVLGLRDSDFVVAARYTNCNTFRVLSRHLLPNTLSHVLVIATTAIPGMILGETSLSFLGLGIRPPMTSWGVLLNEAQKVRVLLQQPWLLAQSLFVLLTIVSFNFVGDGLRDAADPYAT